MTRRRSAAEAERELVRLCHSALEPDEVQARVLRFVRRLMPVDAAFFATADPQTLLFTGARSEEPLAAEAARFLDNEYAGDDVNGFAALAVAPTHVASLDRATRQDRAASPRYREIMRPLGLGDELRSALVVDAECWGYLCLHRADDPLGFSAGEMALIGRLGPHIAQALRRATVLGAVEDRAARERPGVVLLADDLSLVASTPEAEHLMALLDRGPTGLPLPMAVHAVAAALRAIEHGTAPAALLPSATVRARSGLQVTLHAARLLDPSGHGGITVVLDPAPGRPAPPRQLTAHGLTPRESEVATLVLRGATTRDISAALHISANTVQDHLKSIFAKTGVRSRRELVGLLLGP